MSRPAVLAALVGVALASSLPGEGVLEGRDKLLFRQHVAFHNSKAPWAEVVAGQRDGLSKALDGGGAVNWSGDFSLDQEKIVPKP